MIAICQSPPLFYISFHDPSLFKLSTICCFFPVSVHTWQYPILAQSNSLDDSLPKIMHLNLFKKNGKDILLGLPLMWLLIKKPHRTICWLHYIYISHSFYYCFVQSFHTFFQTSTASLIPSSLIFLPILLNSNSLRYPRPHLPACCPKPCLLLCYYGWIMSGLT